MVHLVARDTNAVVTLAGELQSTFSVCDVTHHDQVRQSLQTRAEHRRLVHAVGSIVLKLLPTTPEALHNALATNATVRWIAIQAAEQALKAAHGSVLLFST